jgi:hypothetical protein
MKNDIRLIIASSEVVGGALVLVGYALVAAFGLRPDPLWQVFPGIVFALVSIAAGWLLHRRHRWGVALSLAVQGLQIANLSLPGTLRYVAFAGPLLQLVAASTGVRLNLGGGGAFVLVPWSNDGTLRAPGVNVAIGAGYQPGLLADSQVTLAINFVALYFLWRLLTSVRTEARHTESEVHARAV